MRFAAESPDSSQLLRSCKRGKDGDVREEREGGGGGESRPGAGGARLALGEASGQLGFSGRWKKRRAASVCSPNINFVLG